MNRQVAIAGVVAASLLSGAVVAIGEPKFSGPVIPHRLMPPAAREVRRAAAAGNHDVERATARTRSQRAAAAEVTTSTTPPYAKSRTVARKSRRRVPPPVHSNVVSLSGESAAGPMYSVPTGLTIPAIGVSSRVVALGKGADGTAEVPSGYDFAGWYDLGPRPGEIGPAVILGHVDSISGPAVFFRLSTLLPGDLIMVYEAASSVGFTVERVITYAKDAFPTAQVFGPTPDPELRLITCGGPFDYAIGHYEDNVVVYAQLSRSTS